MSSSEISQYLTEIGRYPVLSEEARLHHCRMIHRWQQWPDGKDNAPRSVARAGERSLEIMVTTNLRLVISVSKKYQSRFVEMQDLIQEGNIGLIRGLCLYDPTRGYQVSTYCYWWIRQGITRAIHTYGRTIRLPINTLELLQKIRKVQEAHLKEHSKKASYEYIAEQLNLTPKRVKDLLDRMNTTQSTSFEDFTKEPDKNCSFSKSRPTEFPAPEPIDPETNPAHQLLDAEILNHLNDDETKVIKGLYEDGHTKQDLAEIIGMDSSKVGTLHAQAVRKLKHKLSVA